MKAVIFTRVSSKEQEEGYSLDSQAFTLEQYCQKNGMEVLKKYRVVESSTVGEREKFKECINYIEKQAKKHKEPIALVVDKTDRLMRGFKEFNILISLVEHGEMELHFARDGYTINKDSGAHDKMMMNMQTLFAQAYVDSLKVNIRRGIDQKIREGEFPSRGPIGYMNISRGSGRKSDIILDETRAFLIKRLFQEYATGTHSLGDMVQLSQQWGLKSRGGKRHLSKGHIHKIIQNPFYCGRMIITGKEYPHRYCPLISEELFEQCQRVRAKANKKPFKYGDKPYIFRGLLCCANCGCSYSSYTKKKRYIYLRPVKSKVPDCSCSPLRQEEVLEQLSKVFGQITIPGPLAHAVREHLKQLHNEKNRFQSQRLSELRKEYDAIGRKQGKLVNLLLDESITQTLHDEKAQELHRRKHEIDRELSGLTNADESFSLALSSLVDILSESATLFESSHLEQKRRIISFVFANLQMNGKKLEFTMRKPFDAIMNIKENEEWRTPQDSNLQPPDS